MTLPMNPSSNPFSTRFWTPGVLPYRFDEAETDLEHLIRQFETVRNRRKIVQIVGPHGSGKTTLLEALARKFRDRGDDVVRATLRDDQRKIEPAFFSAPDRAVHLLDGYEQLSWIDAVLLRTGKWNRGLILTTHRPAFRVPILYRTRPRFEELCRIVRRLTEDTAHEFDETLLREMFDRHSGNFRSVFFELYDRYEQRATACRIFGSGFRAVGTPGTAS